MKNFLNNIKGFFNSVKSHPHAEIKDTNKIEIFDNTIFFVCSVASAFINLIFIANLTKSPYTLGTLLSFPAALFLGLLSFSLDLSKMNHSMKINALTELERELGDKEWVKSVTKIKNKWKRVYTLYVILSILTSVSLSSISIGAGITRNANTLKQIDEFIYEGEQYIGISSTSRDIQMQNLVDKAMDNSEQDAIDFVNKQVSEVWPKIEEWQYEYTEFINNELDPNDKTLLEEKYNGSKSYFDYWTKRDREINNLLSSSKYSSSPLREYQIKGLTLQMFESAIKSNYLKINKKVSSDEANEKLNQLSDTAMEEAIGWIETLNSVSLLNPKTGETVVFDTDINKSPKVLIQSALTILKALRVDVENDSGDIGSSSKIFMQIGSWVESISNKKNNDMNAVLNQKSSGSFGITEISMMLTLLFLSLLCELAINQFSPQPKLTRKLVGKFRRYFPKSFDINQFIFEVNKEKYKALEMTQEEFEEESNLCADIAIKSELTLKKVIDLKKKELSTPKESEFKKEPEIKEEKKEIPVRKVREIKPKETEKKEETGAEEALKNALQNLISKVEQE